MDEEPCGFPHTDHPESLCVIRGTNHLLHLYPGIGNLPNESFIAPIDRAEAKSVVKEIADAVRKAEEHINTAQVGGGKVSHDHPETSHVAADNVKVGSQQAQLLLAFFNAGSSGLNAFEATPRVLNGAGAPVSPNQCNTRLGELREKGLVVPTEVERETTPGNTGIVHVLTNAGVAEAARLRS